MPFAKPLRCQWGWHRWINAKFVWKLEMVLIGYEARYCKYCEQIHPDDEPTIRQNTQLTGILPSYAPRPM